MRPASALLGFHEPAAHVFISGVALQCPQLTKQELELLKAKILEATRSVEDLQCFAEMRGPQPNATVRMRESGFEPSRVELLAGGNVTWELAEHTPFGSNDIRDRIEVLREGSSDVLETPALNPGGSHRMCASHSHSHLL